MSKKKRSSRTGNGLILICPKCGSTDVHVDLSNPVVWSFGARPMHICRNCGYNSAVFPEVSRKEVRDYKKAIENNRSTGRLRGDIIDSVTSFFTIVTFFLGILGILGIISVMLGFSLIGSDMRIALMFLIIGLMGIIIMVVLSRIIKIEKLKHKGIYKDI